MGVKAFTCYLDLNYYKIIKSLNLNVEPLYGLVVDGFFVLQVSSYQI